MELLVQFRLDAADRDFFAYGVEEDMLGNCIVTHHSAPTKALKNQVHEPKVTRLQRLPFDRRPACQNQRIGFVNEDRKGRRATAEFSTHLITRLEAR